jgi:hypothetical protein
LLADLGASVIKIESPQGDMLRQFPSSLAGESRFFLGTNRGKRALALDLKQSEGLAVLHRMVEMADVVVANFRPSVPARLGIDYPKSQSCWSCGTNCRNHCSFAVLASSTTIAPVYRFLPIRTLPKKSGTGLPTAT